MKLIIPRWGDLFIHFVWPGMLAGLLANQRMYYELHRKGFQEQLTREFSLL